MIDFPATSILNNFSLLEANILKIIGLKYFFNILKEYICLVVPILNFLANKKCKFKYQEAQNIFFRNCPPLFPSTETES